MGHHLQVEKFDANARDALQNASLRTAVQYATGLIGGRRKDAAESLPDWEELRETAKSIKNETLEHLDAYLEQFTENAARAGSQIHWARDSKEACEIVSRLARERGARLLVKSKSMATEEIGLNAALEADGLEPVETDLGEYIIQLANEVPSHIIIPAIHKSRGEIGDLFAQKLGIEKSDDPASLTKTARTVLRDKFNKADLGISGVNFAIAETGTIVILENEGNARFSTSLPKTHIAVMGIEKVIPRLADIDVFLKLLPRSGTGQRLTTYQSFITGPKKDSSGEGPDEVHIVLLDNGRSGILSHPVTRQSLRCIRCGACLNTCPVYKQIGGQAYGAVYPGPIGSVITPQLIGLGKAYQLPFASSLCGACKNVCPVKIDIPELLLFLRYRIKEDSTINGGVEPARAAKPNFLEHMAFRMFAMLMSMHRIYGMSAKFARLFQWPLVKNNWIVKPIGIIRRIVSPLGAWTAERDVKPVAKKTFREVWKKSLSEKK